MSRPLRRPSAGDRPVRRLAGVALPILFIVALIGLFPLFDRVFSEGTALLRVRLAHWSTELGVLPRDQDMLLGIYTPQAPYSVEPLTRLETEIGRRFDIVAFYQTWGDRPQDEFPLYLMRAVDRHDAMAMITWEPWTVTFRQNEGRGWDAVRTSLREIADGAYDDFLRRWAREAAAFRKLFFLRMAHEMDNPQYPWSQAAGNTPEDFVDAWRHVWRIFEEEGAENVVWVWSPRGPMPRELYPGGEYVDWVGTSIFNYGAYAEGVWHDFEYLYEPVYRSAQRYEKPIIIAELAAANAGGDPAQWLADAFERIATRYPGTDAVVLYNNPADRTLLGSVIDWSIHDNPAARAVLRNLGGSGTPLSGQGRLK